MFIYLLEKEFKQFFRNRFLPKLVVILPFAALAVFPLVADMDVKKLLLAVVDNDRSSVSQQMCEKIISSGYFTLSNYFDNSSYALQSIENGDADLLLEIPPKFEQLLLRSGMADVMISANAVNGMRGGLGSAYLSRIIADFNKQIMLGTNMPEINSFSAVEVIPLFRFNTTLNYRLFMIPALMAMMLAIICGFLPALNIVSEKENGTIEQMKVTPVGKFYFILSKLIPYWVAGFVVISLCMLSSFIFYDMFPRGSIFLLYLFTAVFVLCFSGFGLIVSNYAKNIQQAIFIMFFFVMTMIFLSGLYTPFQNMPEWAQAIGNVSPLKYFIQVLRMIFLKGAVFFDTLHLLYSLCFLAVLFNGWAVLSYKKRSV